MTDIGGPYVRPSSVTIFMRVVGALIMREVRTRYGRNKLGFAWAIIEPLALAGAFIYVHALISSHPQYGQSIPLFYASGIIPYRMFAGIAGQVTTAIRSNQQLLAYPIVKPIDTVVARTLLESATKTVVLLIAWLILRVTEDITIVHHPGTVISAIAAIILLGASVGYFNAVIGLLFPVWERIWSLMGLPLFISSGIFFVPSQLPPEVLQYLTWNPIMSCLEWFRYGIYFDYIPVMSVNYVLSLSVILLVTALVFEKTAVVKMVER
ncbi:ABC transporter permease [Faunimonas sp. B44]|uniref:ABC transporter permease n=1 Tax=Faunimonas sp. B44 TaxID=3461493 RepID=UPI004044C70C